MIKHLISITIILSLVISTSAGTLARSQPSLLQQKRKDARELQLRINRLFYESEYRKELEQQLEQTFREISSLKAEKIQEVTLARRLRLAQLSNSLRGSTLDTKDTPIRSLKRETNSSSLSPVQQKLQLKRRQLKLVRLNPQTPETPENPDTPKNHFSEYGKASYYGNKFNGRNTASGKIFNNQELTAAHRTLPFGSKVKVTSLSTGNSVIVTITDRGPYVSGRIIDLTSLAFASLEPLSRGVIEVELKVMERVR